MSSSASLSTHLDLRGRKPLDDLAIGMILSRQRTIDGHVLASTLGASSFDRRGWIPGRIEGYGNFDHTSELGVPVLVALLQHVAGRVSSFRKLSDHDKSSPWVAIPCPPTLDSSRNISRPAASPTSLPSSTVHPDSLLLSTMSSTINEVQLQSPRRKELAGLFRNDFGRYIVEKSFGQIGFPFAPRRRRMPISYASSSSVTSATSMVVEIGS